MAVGILPYGMPDRQCVRIADVPLDSLRFHPERPTGRQSDVSGGVVGDLGPDDHLLMAASSRAFTASLRGLPCPVSIVIMEPPAIQRRYYSIARVIGRRYRYVFTYSERLLRTLRNAKPLAHGGATVNLDGDDPPDNKRPNVSLIASAKRTTQGHRLRHQVVALAQQHQVPLDLFGRAYRPVDNVAEALLPFRHSVVIENSRFPGYFTEKLIDCLLCRTIPIYWGDPNVAKRFDTRGIICCDSPEDILRAVRDRNPDSYDDLRPVIEENRLRASRYRTWPLRRAAQRLHVHDIEPVLS